MLNKEEIEKALKKMRSFSRIRQDMTVVTAKEMKAVLQYIEQLETKEQKLIEKSEEDIKKNNEFEFMPLQIEKAYNNYYKLGKIDEAQELLKILKGENN